MKLHQSSLNISILGCGHGGMALAAYWSMQGHHITLWSDPAYNSNLKEIISNNNRITLTGKFLSGESHLNHTTSDLAEAVLNAEIIVVCLPRNAHLNVLNAIARLISNEQLLVILPGKFSAFSFETMLKSANKSATVFETNTFPFACRSRGHARVEVLGIKKHMALAPSRALSDESHERYYAIFSRLFPMKLVGYPNGIALGLDAVGGIIHPINTLFNAARIDNQDNVFNFYAEGISKKTVNVHEMVDKERITIANLYGYKAKPTYEIMNDFYDTTFRDLYEFFVHSQVHNKESLTPSGLQHRYVTEDVAYTLVSWHALGLHKNFKAKTIESIIHLFSIINNKNYFECAKEVFLYSYPSKYDGMNLL